MTLYKLNTLKSTAACALAAIAFTATPALADHHKEKPKHSAQDKMKNKMKSEEKRMEMMEEREEARMEMMEEREEARMEMMREGEEARMEMMQEREKVRMEMMEERGMNNARMEGETGRRAAQGQGLERRNVRAEGKANGYVFSDPVRTRLLAGGLTEAQIAEREARLRTRFEQMTPPSRTTVRTLPDPAAVRASTATSASTAVACPEGTVAQADGTCMMTD